VHTWACLPAELMVPYLRLCQLRIYYRMVIKFDIRVCRSLILNFCLWKWRMNWKFYNFISIKISGPLSYNIGLHCLQLQQLRIYKSHPIYACAGTDRTRGCSFKLFATSALEVSDWSAPHLGLSIPGMTWYPCTKCWVGLGVRLEGDENPQLTRDSIIGPSRL
jgi:hypothetical protein